MDIITPLARVPMRPRIHRDARPYTELQVFKLLAFLIVPNPSFEPVDPAIAPDRQALRANLRVIRERFVADAGSEASTALSAHLSSVLADLMPECLGLYWALRSEFNAALACTEDRNLDAVPLALPFACRSPVGMHYRAWNRQAPELRDECGIPSPDGPTVEPDIVLVPCLGYTRSGFRLGYGGGYYDRWLAEHPHVTPVGVAWSCCEIDEPELLPQPHDLPLMLVVTELGVIG
jgi:5-formyltetrahydrofolate cyclo-ligase